MLTADHQLPGNEAVEGDLMDYKGKQGNWETLEGENMMLFLVIFWFYPIHI